MKTVKLLCSVVALMLATAQVANAIVLIHQVGPRPIDATSVLEAELGWRDNRGPGTNFFHYWGSSGFGLSTWSGNPLPGLFMYDDFGVESQQGKYVTLTAAVPTMFFEYFSSNGNDRNAYMYVKPTAGSWMYLGSVNTQNLGDNTVLVTGLAAGSYSVRVRTGGLGSGDVHFDAVGATGVPEPATLLLLGSGLLGATALRRRKS